MLRGSIRYKFTWKNAESETKKTEKGLCLHLKMAGATGLSLRECKPQWIIFEGKNRFLNDSWLFHWVFAMLAKVRVVLPFLAAKWPFSFVFEPFRDRFHCVVITVFAWFLAFLLGGGFHCVLTSQNQGIIAGHFPLLFARPGIRPT